MESHEKLNSWIYCRTQKIRQIENPEGFSREKWFPASNICNRNDATKLDSKEMHFGLQINKIITKD